MWRFTVSFIQNSLTSGRGAGGAGEEEVTPAYVGRQRILCCFCSRFNFGIKFFLTILACLKVMQWT